MGSGSSSSPNTSQRMPEPTPQPKRQKRARGRGEFEEVQLTDPNAPSVSQSAEPRQDDAASRNKQKQDRKPKDVPNSQGSNVQYGGSGDPGYATGLGAGYDGYQQHENSGPQDMWQYGGQSVQQQQRVIDTFQQQSQLVPQPNQNPDEFLSMALQLQEMGDEDIVFETFHHNNGKKYTCIKQGGKRHYLDSWDTQNWQPFPNKWMSQGVFIRDGDQGYSESSEQTTNESGGNSHRDESSGAEVSGGLGGTNDDRAGSLMHPTRGTLLTYIFEEKRNIHCFFDDNSGMWVKMPISWEQHTDFVKGLIKQVKDQTPSWKDGYDIVAALRKSNYDVDDTVMTYLTVGDTGCMDTPDRLKGFDMKLIKEKDQKIAAQQEKLAKMHRSYDKVMQNNKKLRQDNDRMQKELDQLREKVASLEVEAKTANHKLLALQNERPRTARARTSLASEPPVIETAPSDSVPDTPAEPAGPTVDEETLRKLDKDAKELDKANLTLKKEVQQGFNEMIEMMKEASAALSKMKRMDSGNVKELDELRVLYRKECLQRKLLYNKLQELRGNIRVFCRVRYDSRTECCLQFPSEIEIEATNPAGKKMAHSFDHVFSPTSTQEQVFAQALPIITSCVDGYNVCIMAYGQTGSGKTFTMMGPKDNPGVNVRAIQELLKICSERQQVDYVLKVSMIEVYNEQVKDLLNTDLENKSPLDIKMQGKRLYLQGLTEKFVNNEGDITTIMEMGDANRSVAATKMNSTSSRSHLLLMLTVEGTDKVSNATSFGSLTLVDLAGSERIAKTGATGQTLVEAAAINKSLTSLGQVFTGLRTGALHVPYRNSKLTHLLQPSLSGDAKACLFVNVSPSESNVTETISTLQFGSNARQVALGPATKNAGKNNKK
ncbi:kinesin-like protein klp-3 [Lytechinus pictus]|uniref:kinesin-like protein klp-3 n=1 Tax=Lytechinus pictus TaxID=7653 RepID=UPI0030B9E690